MDEPNQKTRFNWTHSPRAFFKILFSTVTAITGLTSLAFGASSVSHSGSGLVLPENVWNVQLRYGLVTEIATRFNSNGELIGLSRLNQNFDSNHISKLLPDFRTLVATLNETLPSYHLGEQIHLGSLEFTGSPQYEYFAPVLARAITPRWSVALAVPIVRYTSDIQVRQTGINTTSQIRQQFMNNEGVSPTLDHALSQLEQTDLSYEFQKSLESKGYAPLSPQNKTFLGDIKIVSLYELFASQNWATLQETDLQLPTGPEPNADDLQAPSTFAQPAFSLSLLEQWRALRWLTVAGSAGFTVAIPDHVERRTPESREDSLPDSSRKERLERDTGDTLKAGLSTIASLTQALSINLGFEYGTKGADIYKGERGYNYAILSDDTESNWVLMRTGLEFSTVSSYQAHTFLVPMAVAYAYTDTLQGRNIERQTSHELQLKVYF